MKILLVGSGSGGHIYPCLAFGKYLKSNQIEHCYLIFKKIDKDIYESNQIEYLFIENNLKISQKVKEIKKILKENNIDKVVTFGGKNSFFVGVGAHNLKIDLYFCEQNVIFGKANLLLYPLAKYCFASLPLKTKYKKVVNLGNPSSEFLIKKPISLFNNMKYVVLVVCGSLGSSSVDKIIKEYVSNNDSFNFIIIKGKNVTSNYPLKENIKVFDYYQPLSILMNYADLIISRAGATTISEIIALKKPSILIPSPFVSNNHQYKNAKYIHDLNACLMIEEKDLNTKKLNESINKIVYSNYEYQRIIKNIKTLETSDTCKKMLNYIKE